MTTSGQPFAGLTSDERRHLLELAKALRLTRNAPRAAERIEPAARDGELPLSVAQQRLWLLERMGGGGRAHHIAGGVYLEGDLNRRVLRRALDRIVSRHETLRTSFVGEGGQVHQSIAAADYGFLLTEDDVRAAHDPEAELRRLSAEEADRPFELERGPLARGRLVRMRDDAHVLLLTMHHIVSDGWSVGVFLRELSALYGAFAVEGPDPLPALTVQYADYAVWQRARLAGDNLLTQKQYWQSALATAPVRLELPTDRTRPAEQDHAGRSVPVALGTELSSRVRALGQRHGCTLYMTLLAAWSAVLSRLSGQEDLVIGSPVAGRDKVETEPLIGFFINTLPIRLELEGDPSVGELLQRVRSKVLEAQEHKDLPFDQIVEVIRPARSASHTPLFQVLFAWQNTPDAELTLDGLRISNLELAQSTAPFDLALELSEADGVILGALTYATALFDEETIERHARYLRTVLEAMVADDSQRLSALPLMDAAERRRVTSEWPVASREAVRDCMVHELFEAWADRTPEEPALVFGERQLSYAELDARANQMAHRMRRLGVGTESRVAICAERSIERIVAILATFKAGCAYVPLDPKYPLERLTYIMRDCEPAVVVVDAVGESHLPAGRAPVVFMSPEGAAFADEPTSKPTPLPGMNPGSLAYVIYTSGSTGAPKGVMNEHRAFGNLVQTARFGITPASRVLQFASPSFDASVWEMGVALCNGAALCLAEAPDLMPGRSLTETLRRHAVTHVVVPPSCLVVCDPDDMNPDLTVIVAGEAMPVREAIRWARRVTLFNAYGPTEAAVCATSYRCEPGPRVLFPIGRPIPNAHVYILDSRGEPVPQGVCGEIHIGGRGVARGYRNRPDLTAARFVADPFNPAPGSRMYKTGDLGRWLSDGEIEYLGRNDFQVKVRGFRIELGGIESQLASRVGVSEAVVVARDEGGGEKRLVAYYTGENAPTPEALRIHAQTVLPEYMVPSAYVRLEALPLNESGKLDRRALPAPDHEALALPDYAPPQGEIEGQLAEMWARVLKVERIGRHDNFFELGGHSLLAVTLIERMRHAGLHTDVRALFANPTLASVAAAVGSANREVEAPPNRIPLGARQITPEMLPLVELEAEAIDRIVRQVPGGAENVQDIYPLTPLQEGMLFHHLMMQEGDTYLLSRLFGFDCRERLDGFLANVQVLIDRHDVLRTAFVWRGLDEPLQVVQRQATLPVEVVELHPAEGDVVEQVKDRYGWRHNRIELDRAPLLRAIVTRDDARNRWLCLLLAHHVVLDHTTLDLLMREIQKLQSGDTESLLEPVPFRNLVAQARFGVSRAEHESFFRRMLSDVDEPTAPFGLLDVQGDGTDLVEARGSLGSFLASRVRKQARRLRVSAASVMHLAWALVLSRVVGRDDVVFGTLLFGRMRSGSAADRVLGMSINTLPIRIQIGQGSAVECLRRTHDALSELLRHEHAPLALARRASGVSAQLPLFSCLLNYRHSLRAAPGSGVEEAQLEGVEELWVEERTNYPLTLSVDDYGEDFELTVQAKAPADAARVVEWTRGALVELTQALEDGREDALRNLDVMTCEERELVTVGWNPRSDAVRSAGVNFHGVFEAQVSRDPSAEALRFGGESVSYGELNRRANQLARHLQKLGVTGERRAALCMGRSVDMIVAVLAVLKAGGTYLPLDPGYPQERLRYMLEDSGSIAVVVDERGQKALGEVTHTVVDWTDRARWSLEEEGNLPPGEVNGWEAAYIIYTSGSTGRPKGVVNEHRGLTHLIEAQRLLFGVGPGSRVLQFASFSFDASVWELVMALGNGACLCLAEGSELMPGRALLRTLRENAITHVTLPPSALGLCEDEDFTAEVLVVAGEAISAKDARKWSQRVALFNAYGPTEATVCATVQRCDARLSGVVPIGRPMGHTRMYILDDEKRPVPVGVTGELYIGGAGVARGYLNRPELTAERFVNDPFSSEPGSRMYKTGDLGRWLPNGAIEYLGRNDFQVKVRGFRIELGEIESHLARIAGVSEVVVVARDDGASEKRLVAYYTGTGAPTVDELRACARTGLPEYMVPSAYVRLEAFPLNANGKLDRAALPAPDQQALSVAEYVSPEGEVEEKLAQIWADLLEVERIGRHDNFFDLGGHSLLAVQVVSRVERLLDVEVPLRELLQNATLARFAAVVGTERSPSVPSNLVPIRSQGSLGPLFIVHAIDGAVSYIRDLAERLDPRRPIYALEASGFDSRDRPSSSVSDMASRYVESLRVVQPHGPYRLLGYSSGGVIAHAMAARLVDSGEAVEFLGLVDTYSDASIIDANRELAEHIALYRGSGLDEIAVLRDWVEKEVPSDRLDEWRGVAELGDMANMIAWLKSVGVCPEDVGVSAVKRMVGVRMGLVDAVSQHRPTPVRARATLFQASDRQGQDPTLGWASIQGEYLETIPVPGPHAHLVSAPYIEGVVRAIEEALER